MHEFGVCGNVLGLFFEDDRVVRCRGNIGVTMAQPINHPGGVNVDEHRPVVSAPRWCQHPRNFHFEWIDAGKIKQRFRGRDDIIATGKFQCFGNLSADHALAQSGEQLAAVRGKVSVLKIV
ncbi:MAG TPA: hypothetical protein DDX99_06985 [Desulfofustis sp.]|nr:hypothetical protein [Desulfofustis sp.]